MIKFIVKLLVVALIANATWRIGTAYANFYRFQDAVQQAAQFRGRKSDEELRERLLALAAEHEILLKSDDLMMRKEFNHFIVDASFVRIIDLFPGYPYPWPFAVHTDVLLDR